MKALGRNARYIPIDDAATFSPPSPKSLGDNELVARLRRRNPPLFAAQLREARVYGDPGDVVTADGVLLTDLSHVYASDLWFMRRKHPLISSDPLPEPGQLGGTFALLTAPFAGSNYFHWLFTLLPRIAILERAGVGLPSLDGFLINRLQFPALQHDMLRVVGVEPERQVEMDERDAFQPEVVWVTPSLHSSGHRRPWVCAWLREKFLISPPSAKPSRRLYISRADASRRHVVNEDEVMAFLAPLGFERVVIGSRSVFEQSALFASAEIVLGLQSAALANILFCLPGTRVIDIIPSGRHTLYYWELSACLGLDYYYAITARLSMPGVAEGDAIIRLDRLASVLRLAGVN